MTAGGFISRVVTRWWNDLLGATRTGVSLSIFKKLLKTQLFRESPILALTLYFPTPSTALSLSVLPSMPALCLYTVTSDRA